MYQVFILPTVEVYKYLIDPPMLNTCIPRTYVYFNGNKYHMGHLGDTAKSGVCLWTKVIY